MAQDRSLLEQLAAARKRSGRKQEEIADAIGVARSHISNLENEHSDTTTGKAETWAALCGYRILVVPVGGAGDPEDLHRQIDALTDPAARDLLSRLLRLVNAAPHRYWYKFRADFDYEMSRYERDRADELGEAPPGDRKARTGGT